MTEATGKAYDRFTSRVADYGVASGTSYTDQIGDLLDSDPVHPVELLDPGTR